MATCQTCGMDLTVNFTESHNRSDHSAAVVTWAAASAGLALAASLWLAFGPCYVDRPACSSMLGHFGAWVLVPLSFPVLIPILGLGLAFRGSTRWIWPLVIVLVLLAVATSPLGAPGVWYVPSMGALVVARVMARRGVIR